VGILTIVLPYWTETDQHAMLWTGTAASAIDLSTLLPANFSSSEATAIDPTGNIFGWALDSSGNYHAIEWSSVTAPEPASLSVLALSTALFARRRSPQPK
jgi:hypothetical protein